jgi:hypothetical protein
MNSKRKSQIYFLALCLGTLMAASPLWAEQKDPQPPAKSEKTAVSKEDRRQKKMAATQEKRKERLEKQLGLDATKAEKINQIMVSYNEKKQEITKKRREKLIAMKKELDAEKPNTSTLEASLKEIEKMDHELHSLRQQENQEINKSLTTVEQAKYLVFQQNSRHAQRSPQRRPRGKK